ncbi:TPA: hypothetical protein ACH3X1_007834 [Trebouxia sp. C0004]
MDGHLPSLKLSSTCLPKRHQIEPACLLRRWQIVLGLLMENWISRQDSYQSNGRKPRGITRDQSSTLSCWSVASVFSSSSRSSAPLFFLHLLLR